MNTENLQFKIRELCKKKNAVILAHYYQSGEIQDIADFIGDSLGLSKNAQNTNADIIVFAGVKFMAETAKIVNPTKKVLIPDLEAGCSLSDNCPVDKLADFIKKYPGHKVISYINCSAEVKCISDIICTSSNAKKIVESFNQDQPLIFAPDKNLGAYINKITGRNMVLWDGSCEVHDNLTIEKIIHLKSQNPEAEIIAHPECKQVILELSNFIGSTTELLQYSIKSKAKKFIVATETGILHQMKKLSPEKEFYIVPAEESCNCNDCPYMKMNTLEKIYNCLIQEKPEIVLSELTLQKALIPIKRMLEISN